MTFKLSQIIRLPERKKFKPNTGYISLTEREHGFNEYHDLLAQKTYEVDEDLLISTIREHSFKWRHSHVTDTAHIDLAKSLSLALPGLIKEINED